MKIKSNLSDIKKEDIVNGNFSNRKILLRDYEELEELKNLSSEIDNFAEAEKYFQLLNASELSRQFIIDLKPYFVRLIIKRINSPLIIEDLLELDQPYFPDEKFLSDRKELLHCFSHLEKSLRSVRLKQKELKIALKNLNSLKTLLSEIKISTDDLKWFFTSDIFKFVTKENSFSIESSVSVLFKNIINSIPFNRKIASEIQKIINEKNGESYYEVLFSIFDTWKKESIAPFKKSRQASTLTSTKSLVENTIETNQNVSNSKCDQVDLNNNTCEIFQISNQALFYKLDKVKALSPMEKQALYNNLKEHGNIPAFSKNGLKR